MKSIDNPRAAAKESFTMKTFGASSSDLGGAESSTVSNDPLLGRVAACLWFLVMAIVYARGLADTIRAVPAENADFSAWSAVLSRSCSLIFLVTLGWLMLV